MTKIKRLKLAFVGCLLMAGLLAGCTTKKGANQDEKTVPVRVLTVKSTEGSSSRNFVGVVEEESSTALSFAVMGSIESFLVDEGEHVKQGDLLAVLNKTTLKSSHEAAQASLNQAKDAYVRLKKLYDNNSLPEIKWVEMQSNLQKASSMEQIARKNLQDAELRAPFSGVVGEKRMDVGSNAMPGVPVITIYKINKIKVKIAIPENEISMVKKGDDVSITVAALNNKTFKGKISEKGAVADRLSHTYDARIKMTNTLGELMPGMVCNVTLLSSSGDLLTIPNSAIQIDSNGSCYVWIAENGTAKRRNIVTGILTSEGVAVNDGLKEGDKVIVEGNQKVSEGMKIEVR